jgi:hypothetical protein
MYLSIKHVLVYKTHVLYTRTCFIHKYMFYTQVHVLCTSSCFIHKYMFYSQVHVLFTSTCFIHKYMFYTQVHVSVTRRESLVEQEMFILPVLVFVLLNGLCCTWHVSSHDLDFPAVSCGCIGATVYAVYAAVTKTDVRFVNTIILIRLNLP